MQRTKELYTSKFLIGKTILIPELNILYGGNLYFPKNHKNNKSPYIFANFVQSVDGITSYDSKNSKDSFYISKNNAQDRFIVSLLRSICDAVIIGEKTLNAETDHVWISEFMCPEYKNLFIKQRKLLDKKEQPYNIFVTAGGTLNLNAVIFIRDDIRKIIVTTYRGYKYLVKNNLFNKIRQTDVIVLKSNENNDINLKELVRLLKIKFGINYLLVEGGPCLYGSFEKSRLIDELFLTTSPIIAGNSYKKHRQTISMSSQGYTPTTSPTTKILSINKYNNYLYLRRKYIY